MQYVGGHYSTGTATDYHHMHYPPTSDTTTNATTGPSTTSVLRSWRKKDATEKQSNTTASTEPPNASTESQGPVARVAPHNHYPKPPPITPDDIYRYPQQYGDFSVQNPSQLPAPVKYSEIIEPMQSIEQIPPIHLQKPKEKTYLDMCSVQQNHMKTYHHQEYPNYKQHYDGIKNYNHMSSGFKQQYHHPHPYLQKESQISGGYMQKETNVPHPPPPQYLHNYKMSPPSNYPRNYPREGGNEFLANLNKIAPDMAQDIINDPHLREPQFPMYPPAIDQNRLYQQQHHQRMYQRSSPIQYPPVQNYPQKNIPQNYNQYQMNQQRIPPSDPYRMYAPHQRYGQVDQIPNNISPRQYHENIIGFPPRIASNYPPCNQLEYPPQHYQPRQVPIRQDFLPPPPNKPYIEAHPDIPEIVPEDSLHQPKKTLKAFLENWREEFTEDVDASEQGNSDKIQLVKAAVPGRESTLYVLDAMEIPSENIPQYLHLQPLEKLPANIRAFTYNPNEENIRQNAVVISNNAKSDNKTEEISQKDGGNAYQLFQQSKDDKRPDNAIYQPNIALNPFKSPEISSHDDRPACKLLQSMANARNASANDKSMEKQEFLIGKEKLNFEEMQKQVCRSLPELITDDTADIKRNQEQLESEYSKIVDSILEENTNNVKKAKISEEKEANLTFNENDLNVESVERKSVIAENTLPHQQSSDHKEEASVNREFHDEERTITKITNEHLPIEQEDNPTNLDDLPNLDDPIDLSHHFDELQPIKNETETNDNPDEEETKPASTDVLSLKDVLNTTGNFEEIQEEIKEEEGSTKDIESSCDPQPEIESKEEDKNENVSAQANTNEEHILEDKIDVPIDNEEGQMKEETGENIKTTQEENEEIPHEDGEGDEETIVELSIIDVRGDGDDEIEYIEEMMALQDEEDLPKNLNEDNNIECSNEDSNENLDEEISPIEEETSSDEISDPLIDEEIKEEDDKSDNPEEEIEESFTETNNNNIESLKGIKGEEIGSSFVLEIAKELLQINVIQDSNGEKVISVTPLTKVKVITPPEIEKLDEIEEMDEEEIVMEEVVNHHDIDKIEEEIVEEINPEVNDGFVFEDDQILTETDLDLHSEIIIDNKDEINEVVIPLDYTQSEIIVTAEDDKDEIAENEDYKEEMIINNNYIEHLSCVELLHKRIGDDDEAEAEAKTSKRNRLHKKKLKKYLRTEDILKKHFKRIKIKNGKTSKRSGKKKKGVKCDLSIIKKMGPSEKAKIFSSVVVIDKLPMESLGKLSSSNRNVSSKSHSRKMLNKTDIDNMKVKELKKKYQKKIEVVRERKLNRLKNRKKAEKDVLTCEDIITTKQPISSNEKINSSIIQPIKVIEEEKFPKIIEEPKVLIVQPPKIIEKEKPPKSIEEVKRLPPLKLIEEPKLPILPASKVIEEQKPPKIIEDPKGPIIPTLKLIEEEKPLKTIEEPKGPIIPPLKLIEEPKLPIPPPPKNIEAQKPPKIEDSKPPPKLIERQKHPKIIEESKLPILQSLKVIEQQKPSTTIEDPKESIIILPPPKLIEEEKHPKTIEESKLSILQPLKVIEEQKPLKTIEDPKGSIIILPPPKLIEAQKYPKTIEEPKFPILPSLKVIEEEKHPKTIEKPQIPQPPKHIANPDKKFQMPKSILKNSKSYHHGQNNYKDFRRSKSDNDFRSDFLENFKKRRLSLEEYNSRKKRNHLINEIKRNDKASSNAVKDNEKIMVEEVLKSLKKEEMEFEENCELKEDEKKVNDLKVPNKEVKIEDKQEEREEVKIESKPIISNPTNHEAKAPIKEQIDKFTIEEKLNSLEEFLPKIAPKEAPSPRRLEESQISKKLEEIIAENPIAYSQKAYETALINRFLNRETLTVDELKRVGQIVQYKRAIQTMKKSAVIESSPKRRHSSEYPKSIKIDFSDFDLKKNENPSKEDEKIVGTKICYNRSISAFIEEQSKKKTNIKGNNRPGGSEDGCEIVEKQDWHEKSKRNENQIEYTDGDAENAVTMTFSGGKSMENYKKNKEEENPCQEVVKEENHEKLGFPRDNDLDKLDKESFAVKNKHSILNIISNRGENSPPPAVKMETAENPKISTSNQPPPSIDNFPNRNIEGGLKHKPKSPSRKNVDSIKLDQIDQNLKKTNDIEKCEEIETLTPSSCTIEEIKNIDGGEDVKLKKIKIVDQNPIKSEDERPKLIKIIHHPKEDSNKIRVKTLDEKIRPEVKKEDVKEMGKSSNQEEKRPKIKPPHLPSFHMTNFKPISKTKAQLKSFQDSLDCKSKTNDAKEQNVSPVISNITKLTALLTYYKKGLESGADNANLKKIEDIINRLSPNLKNLPNLPETASSEYEVAKPEKDERHELKLHLKKKFQNENRKRKKRFRNLYSGNDSDEECTSKSKEAKIEEKYPLPSTNNKNSTDYSVYQRKSPAGVPKLVIKRRKSDFKSKLQPYVRIKRIGSIESMVKRRKRSILIDRIDLHD